MLGEIPTPEKVEITTEVREALERNTAAFLDSMEQGIVERFGRPPKIGEAREEEEDEAETAFLRRVRRELSKEVKPLSEEKREAIERYAMITAICARESNRALACAGHVKNRHGKELPSDDQNLIRNLYEASGILTELEKRAREQLGISEYSPEVIEVQKRYKDLIEGGRWAAIVSPVRAENLLAFQALKAGEFKDPQEIIYGKNS